MREEIILDKFLPNVTHANTFAGIYERIPNENSSSICEVNN